VASAVDRLVTGGDRIGRTDALVVVQGGEVVVEHYGGGVDATTVLPSWSMAKSVLHAVVGILVAGGRIDPEDPVEAPEWPPDDPRRAITVRHLLTMRSGLQWVEDPSESSDGRCDSVEMAYGDRRADGHPVPLADTAAFAAERPLAVEPGQRFQYSGACSALLARLVRDAVGAEAQPAWLRDQLFGPLGMASARCRFDRAGTWIAASFCHCTARDFASFGRLYLDRGTRDGVGILPADWVATAAEPTGSDTRGRVHTMHWWRFGGVDDNPWGAWFASGYLGQYLVVLPALDAVVVRLGETPTASRGTVDGLLAELAAGLDGAGKVAT